ncbi:MAG: FAD-dependent monooxygenase [Acidimicrobiia bacterium]
MRVAAIGGGPGGLFAAIVLRLERLAHEVVVHERNGPEDTFGFGVVFSNETLENVAAADPISVDAISAASRHWSGIDIVAGGSTIHSTGHGFSAISRLRLLQILTARARELGVEVRFHSEVPDVRSLGDADLVVAADGANSAVRTSRASRFGPEVEWGEARYAWFGTPWNFDSFTFLFEETEHGVFQAHCYPYSDDMGTVIIETSEATWRAAGLDASGEPPLPPGTSDEEARSFTEKLLAPHLGGMGLVGNNSKWLRFPTISNERWSDGNVVLIGDAAHTAHFSVGSGTKLAMEDAVALGQALGGGLPIADALLEYEANRKPGVESLQRAAHTSRQWFESADRYVGAESEPFAFQLLTRSQRITLDNLRLRDPSLTERVETWFRSRQRHEADRPDDPATPPMFYPFTLRGLRLPNRIVVSPMAQYSAVEGMPDDWHLVHLGSRAVGGAGLVMTEMTCVTPEGRITPGCTGLWNEEQQAEWERIVRFVHRETDAAIGLQLGHAGRKGSMEVPWEAGGVDDVPLRSGGWPLLAPSPIPWRPGIPEPKEMTRPDMDRAVAAFADSARRGAAAGFDLLELHMAHGYLLSSFLSPLSNRRTDGYGGTLIERARFPLEVLAATRSAWPEDRPLAVRISATDWVEGGNTGDDAVALARLFGEAGCDLIDVSTGQVHPDQEPRYGRLYQTPFSDRIRSETGIPTVTVGAVSSVDDVNTILLAGRADLCAIARGHLVDPYWTLNAAIDQQAAGHPWPRQYLSGKTARRRSQDPAARIDDPGNQ